MQALHIRNDTILDVVPVDFVANTIIAAAWKTATKKSLKTKCLIYNCITGDGNQIPITWKSFLRLVAVYMKRNPPEEVFWYISLFFCESPRMFKWLSFFVHQIPGVIGDFVNNCLGRKSWYG